ncbi:MAG: cation transporter [Desulfosporosinus sp.]
MMKKTYKVEGMHCASCATMIELDLEDIGIKAKCSYANGTLDVEGEHDSKKIVEVVNKSGYSIK